MATKSAYGPPPDSDSDDSSYDGFYFDKSFVREKRKPYIAKDQALHDALRIGSLEQVRAEIEAINIAVNEPVLNGYTMLMHACREGHYSVAEYLIEQLKANVNKQVDSDMPLMLACDCSTKDQYMVEKLVRLLLRHDAAINVSDKYGMTPFMFACRNGYANIVSLMIKKVSFDAVDNEGRTAIFHAVENNRPEIVKLLVEAGVDTTKPNNKGYTPTQVAEIHGFYDLLELMPRPRESYVVPTQYLYYNKLSDHIPRIFLKTDCPEYFQEVNSILCSLNMENLVQHFAKSRISLADFLTMDEQKLCEIGVTLPIYRAKIMKGILDFHLHHWSKKSIAHCKRDGMDSFYEVLMITANHLQHLVIIQASLRFVTQVQMAGKLGQPSESQLLTLKSNLKAYRDAVNDLTKTVKYLASFSPPKNPLYIDYDEFVAERKRKKVCKYFKFTTTTILLGISVFICFKSKHLF